MSSWPAAPGQRQTPNQALQRTPGALVVSREFTLGRAPGAAELCRSAAEGERMASGFFPPGALDPRPELEGLLDGWFSKHLRSMGEPPLWPVSDTQPLTFRFTGLPTWDKPYAVRVERQADGWLLAGKMTAGNGGYDEGTVLRRVSGRLAPSEAHRLDRLVSKLGYWELPGVIDDGGCDGVQWVLEAAETGRYHVAHRWCPDKGEFAEFCLFLGQLGGFHAG